MNLFVYDNQILQKRPFFTWRSISHTVISEIFVWQKFCVYNFCVVKIWWSKSPTKFKPQERYTVNMAE